MQALRAVSTEPEPTRPHDPALWAAVDRLIDRAPRPSDLECHGLELLAVQRCRRLGRQPSAEAIAAEQASASLWLIAPLVLAHAVQSIGDKVVLMKGPEVAAWYPNALARGFHDVDLLVQDPDAAWHAMVTAGFRPVGDPRIYIGIHHLRPLAWPGMPLAVEVHAEPKWIEFISPPTEELLATAVPSETGVPDLLALEPSRHAVCLAVHAWAHAPLSNLRRLIDIAAVAQGTERERLDELACSWGVERVWRTTSATLDSLLAGKRRPLVGHIWARHLWGVRERTVHARRLERWLAPFSAYPARQASRVATRSMGGQLRRLPEERWIDVLHRYGRSLRNSFKRMSEHETTPAEDSWPTR